MKRHGTGLAIGALLVVSIGLLATNNAAGADDEDDKQIKAARKEILALAKEIENGKVDAKRAQAIRKKYAELNHLMIGFKPRDKNGIGYGPKGEAIDSKLNSLGKRALAKDTLDKEAAALVKMAYINLAYAEIAYHYAPLKPKAGKGPKEWKQYTADWKTGTKDFIGAVKKGDAEAVKKAANNLHNTCNSCHSDFRDVS
jgi:cytochrome c556